jgi:diguanylate cyclase (GGDEF)-like protein
MNQETKPAAQIPEAIRASTREIRERLEKLERRDWWLWVSAVAVMLLLALATVSFTFPMLFSTQESSYAFRLSQATRGLLGLVLLFSVYAIYQQVLIKRLRRDLARQLAVMTDLETQAEEFHQLATHDSLTGLYNRRFIEQRLTEEASRSRRYGHPFTLLLFDLNDFKHINDRYGHPAGDLVLKSFAARLRAELRISDLPARVGGDEFLVLLPECPEDHVRHLLPRFETIEVEWQAAKIPITYAAGWASYRSGEQPKELLARADHALYADKRARKQAAPPVPLSS